MKYALIVFAVGKGRGPAFRARRPGRGPFLSFHPRAKAENLVPEGRGAGPILFAPEGRAVDP